MEYSISHLEFNTVAGKKQQQFLPCWTVIYAALAVDTDSSESTFIKQCAAVNTMLFVSIDPLHFRSPWMTEKLQKYNLPSKSRYAKDLNAPVFINKTKIVHMQQHKQHKIKN